MLVTSSASVRPSPLVAGCNGAAHVRGPNVGPLRHAARRAVMVRAGERQPIKVMISGAPAAGKGTQCARIVEDFGLVHISAGDLLRAEVASGTPAGKRASEFMTAGKLVPNEVVVEMVVKALASVEAQEHGWLLDGYPRSEEQAEAIQAAGIRPDIFLLLNVPDDALVERVVGRRMDPITGEIYHMKFKPPPPEIVPRLVQRSDDTEEAVRTRLATYHANLNSVLSYYEDVLVQIDGSRSMPDVYADVKAALEKLIRERETDYLRQTA